MTAHTVREPQARHGRREWRMLWALTDPAFNARAGEAGTHGIPWPQLRQACRVARRRVDCATGESTTVVSYAITSLPPTTAGARRLLERLRGHWGIENRLCWVRDITLVRSETAPRDLPRPGDHAVTPRWRRQQRRSHTLLGRTIMHRDCVRRHRRQPVMT